MQIYNNRRMLLNYYIIQAPKGTSWDGNSFVTDGYWKFTRGRFNRLSSRRHGPCANVEPEDYTTIHKKAILASIKQGLGKVITITPVYKYPYRYKKPNRFM